MKNLLHTPVRKSSWYSRDTKIRAGKPKMWISVLILIGVTLCIELALYAIQASADTDKILSSIPRKMLIASAQITPTPTPELTHKQIIEQAKHSDIIYRIWGNETTYGTNQTKDPTALHTYCAKEGKTNEFGFDPMDKKCFTTFKESVQTIDNWFDNCLNNTSLESCLERYSGNSKLYISSFLNQ